VNDELDEAGWKPDHPEGPSKNTRTMVWDVRNLSDPKLVGNFYSTEVSIDHNLYVDGELCLSLSVAVGEFRAPSREVTLRGA